MTLILPKATVLSVGGGGGRSGVVHAEGRNYVDAGGVFWPYGHTLFWALRGWKFERPRIKENIDWCADQGHDYIRCLAEVDWTISGISLGIHPSWPDYEEQLGGLIDYVAERGMRVQLTLIGSRERDDVVEKVIRVVNTRTEKILFLEVANEWDVGQKIGEERMKEIGRQLIRETGNLVALSQVGEFNAARWGDAQSCMTDHFDRADNTVEWKWRHVRKPWEPRQPLVPSSSNEPGGPRSSVAQYEEPLHLVMMRAVAILCGWYGFVLHNASGIFGVWIDVYGGRYPNVWETPGIELIARILRKLESILPAGGGIPTRKGLGPHPLSADAFVGDGGRGVVRDYALVQGGGFWQTLIGIKDHVNLTSDAHYTLKFINPLTGETLGAREVSAGETFRVDPHPSCSDSRGFGAFIVIGQRV